MLGERRLMHFDLITIFPQIFEGFLGASLINKAIANQIVSFNLVNFREFAEPPHFSVDDLPYGGGPGMVLKPEPLVCAVEKCKLARPAAQVVLFSCAGQLFTQQLAKQFSQSDALILLCGRYEGVDQRVVELVVDHEVSIGDYVLMGGEVAAMVFIEATVRLLDRVLGNNASALSDSFSSLADQQPLLEAPQYTRPPVFRGLEVPELLRSGNHQQIEKWRKEMAFQLTSRKRPDLLGRAK